MAINLNNPLVGEVLEGFLAKAALGNTLAQHMHVEFARGRKKLYMPRIKTGKMFQERVEQPALTDSKGDFNIDSVALEPRDIMAFTTFNPRSLEGIWRPYQPEGPLVFHNLSAEAQAMLIREFQKGTGQELADLYLNADLTRTEAAGSKYYSLANGLLAVLKANPDVKDVTSPVALTAANINSKFKAAVDLVPDTIRENPDLKIFTSRKTAEIYSDANKAESFKGRDQTQRGVRVYDGIDIIVLPFMPDNTFLVAVSNTSVTSNIWAAVDYGDDEDVIQIDKFSPAGERYFFKMQAKLDVQVGFGEEIVFYHVPAA